MSNAPRTGPLGVLLVHGIGEQQVGDTLLGFTEPLQTFCEEWVEGAAQEEGAEGYARVTHTRLRRVTGDDGAPSHTRLRAGLERPGSEDTDGEMESWRRSSSGTSTSGCCCRPPSRTSTG